VASFATSDFDKVKTHLSSLSSIDQLTKGIDVSALLSAGVTSLPAPTPSVASKKRKLDTTATAVEATRKKRRRKLPKDYDPNRKMDPERWLPLRDRSSYRPKGKKGKKKAAEATQGGVVKDEETLELAGGAGSLKVEKAPQGGGGGGKKKKKGRK
jgi:signal recognition particle subunit SRP72